MPKSINTTNTKASKVREDEARGNQTSASNNFFSEQNRQLTQEDEKKIREYQEILDKNISHYVHFNS